MPERGVWSIPIKPEEEHMLAVPRSGGFSVLLMQKQGREYSPETKEDESENVCRRRIPIMDDEPDITLSFKQGFKG